MSVAKTANARFSKRSRYALGIVSDISVILLTSSFDGEANQYIEHVRD